MYPDSIDTIRVDLDNSISTPLLVYTSFWNCQYDQIICYVQDANMQTNARLFVIKQDFILDNMHP